MSALTVRLLVDASALSSALAELSQLAERFPDAVQVLLDGSLGIAELARLDPNIGFADWAGECRIALQPSERLRDFLAAFRALDVDPMRIEIDGHANPVV
ncbi:hypothetical protein QZM92_26715 [Burkholderia multivorans]|nr:hypothetical protein [Burkholderia multivorans]